MQLPQARSDESRRRVWAPNGLALSLRVEPNRARVGMPDTQAICMRPESSERTKKACWRMAKAWEGEVLPIILITWGDNEWVRMVDWLAINAVPRSRNWVDGRHCNHRRANAI